MNKEIKAFLDVMMDVAKESCEVRKKELALKKEEKAKKEEELRLKVAEQNQQQYIAQNTYGLKKFMKEAFARTRQFNAQQSLCVENAYSKEKKCWFCRTPISEKLSNIQLRNFKNALTDSVAELTRDGIRDFQNRIITDRDLIERESQFSQENSCCNVNWNRRQQDYSLFYDINAWMLYRIEILSVQIDSHDGYLYVCYNAFDESHRYYNTFNYQTLICS